LSYKAIFPAIFPKFRDWRANLQEILHFDNDFRLNFTGIF
jgi:hypothetical protein